MLKIKKRAPREYVLYSLIIAVGIILDQLTKWLSVKFLAAKETVPLIEGVFHFTYVENTGAAFGSFKDNRWVFMITSTIMIIALIGYLYLGFAENNLYAVALSLIASGGIGNMIDRIALGYVVDFLHFKLINFAVFNVADSFVCIGAGLLILALILDVKKEAQAKKKATQGEADTSPKED